MGGITEATHLFQTERIRQFACSLFEAYGATRENAAIVTDHLVESSLAGMHSHGLIRVPQYIREIEEGLLDPAAQPVRSAQQGSRVTIEGNRSSGQVAATFAVAEAVTTAAAHGVAVVTVRRCAHIGRVGVYPEAIARQGYLALAFCSASPRQQRVAPLRAREARLSTNPIAYAFPTATDPVVGDIATSAIAEGKIRSLRNRGLPAPHGALHDGRGAPTTDPNVLYEDPPGTLQPLGGPDFGHKGFALSLLVEAMSTLLSHEDPVDDSRHGNVLTIVSIAVDAGYVTRAERLLTYVRSAEPIDPARPVVLPGEPERQARRAAEGVLIDAPTWEAIVALAEARRLPVPAPMGGVAVERPGA